MIFGNVAALVQQNIKRMLAYSSIAHAGYILVGVAAMLREPQAGASAALLYLLIYSLATVGAFAVVAHLSRAAGDADSLEAYRGLGRRHPWLAVALTLYLLSLAGIPPLVGFVGKFALFAAAIKAGLVELAIVGVLTSALSVYYYIRVIYLMVMAEAEEGRPAATALVADWPGRAALIVTAVLVLVLGVAPMAIIAWAGQGAAMLLGK